MSDVKKYVIVVTRDTFAIKSSLATNRKEDDLCMCASFYNGLFSNDY